jgi:hypothetical protein
VTLTRGAARFSDLVSALLNPSAATGVLFCLVAARFEPPGSARLVHDIIGVAATAVVPVGLLFVLRSAGRLSDLEMRDRAERGLDLMLCTGVYAIGTGLLLATGASWPLWGLLAIHVPNTIVLFAFNRRLKVSIHAMVLTGLWAASLILLGSRWLPAGLLVPLAAWARWDAGNHTGKEILWGILLGGALTPVELLALRAVMGRA